MNTFEFTGELSDGIGTVEILSRNTEPKVFFTVNNSKYAVQVPLDSSDLDLLITQLNIVREFVSKVSLDMRTRHLEPKE